VINAWGHRPYIGGRSALLNQHLPEPIGSLRVWTQSTSNLTYKGPTPMGSLIPFVHVTTPSPAPGWYPDPSDPARQIYWDGTAWSGPPQRARTPNFTPAAPPAEDSSDSRKKAVSIGVAVLAVVGLFMSMQSVSLMTGSGPVWTGVAVVGGAVALAFFLRAAKAVRVVAVILLAISVANAFYIENELSQKSDEITHVFDHR
jgi:multidrug transporter EmrE-like cation transporter